MPVVNTSSYQNVEAVLNRLRTMLNDSEIQGGDVITDVAPFTFQLIQGGFERVQIELAQVGVETMQKYWWVLAIPQAPTADPECRVTVDDAGTEITYPGGIGNAFFLSPQLPPDLVIPMKLWERQNGTTNFVNDMKQPNTGLTNISQQAFLVDWEWTGDQLMFRGALQTQDIKIKGEKQLPTLVAVTDPVPIRGVVNAAAYQAARIFVESRGGIIAPQFAQDADKELELLKGISARRRQFKQVRRRPYSGRMRQKDSPI